MKMVMRRLISLVAVLLLLASAAPVMACVTNLAMSHEESACCRSMHGQCGEMAKQGCCQTVVHNDSPQLATEFAAPAVHWTVLTQIHIPPTPVTLDDPTRQMFLTEHSPPGLLIAQTTVLRI
jgi:hypothetical protein